MLKNIKIDFSRLVLVFVIFQTTFCGFAQAAPADQKAQAPAQSTNPEPSPAQLQIHQELRALNVVMSKAMNSMDIDTILANVTDDVVFTTMNGDVARGRDGIRKYFEDMMKGPNRRVISVNSSFVADDLSHIYNDSFAVAFGASKSYFELVSGTSIDVNARWSAALAKRDGRWLIANFHFSTNMFDNPVLDAQRKFMLTVGVIAAIFLVLCSFWIGLVRGRRIRH